MQKIKKTKTVKIRFFSRLIAGLMRLVYWTSRNLFVNRELVDELAEKHGAVIFALWHGSFFPFVYFAHKNYQNITIMTSLSDDGELLSGIIRSFGGDVVRGDERRGGVQGLVGMIRAFRRGRNLVFAADGPLGPRHQIKPGVIAGAAKTGAPIIPVACSSSRAFLFRKAWDRFFFPWPFSRLVTVFGEPFYVPSGADQQEKEACRLKLEKRLAALTSEADSLADAPFRQVRS